MKMRSIILVVILCLFPAETRADFVDNILNEKDVAQKEVLGSRNKDGVTSEQVGKLVQRERHSPVVALVVGQYFEKNTLDKNTPEVLRMLAKRSDIAAQSIAYAALNPDASKLIKGLAASDAKADQRIAARMLAATAVMRHTQNVAEGQQPGKKKGGKGKQSSILHGPDYIDEVKTLLSESRDEVALEYTLLAVGLGRIKGVTEPVAMHAQSKRPEVALAAQYALACIGGEVDAEAVLGGIAQRPRSRKPRPALSYDPRQTPRNYAIMAAGEAKLADAVDPLMDLIVDKDLHNAVFAARALGRIAGEGIGPRMLDQINEDMLWPVRIAIYDAVGRNPDKAAVTLLKEHFSKEPGRLRQDALYALLSIVAGKPEAMTYDAFANWWNEHGDSFEVDPDATRAWRLKHRVGEAEVQELAGFYESAVISDRPVFAVDASKSMQGAQIESLIQTLDEVVDSFPDRVQFGIVDFGGHVRSLGGTRLIPARNSKRAMHQFKYEMELTGATRSYDAIERAMDVTGMDTVHFLSDGSPIGGHLDHWNRINYATRLRCFVAPVAVHAIYFPDAKVQGKATGKAVSMQRFAEDHAGRFHVIVAQPEKKK